ncbi:hypothetical protein AWW66_25295 [Micromonospora rosaria]|uniref:Uncharacterized protein n=1 Tax=Micromonospora rosaria TaxID=47874 RepID=A0A136PLM8_9ACTN|nr:hypothetical protein [Micromonospora rosaria]KXK59268.1 hypothetical protein AWW66_25295 [Micromonospora rosaria]
MKQNTADGAMLGPGKWSLVPPGSDDFEVYGGAATVERAREWAFRHQVLLYRGPGQTCVHGLYRMDVCTFRACTSVGMDHTQIWVQHDGRGAFLLTHPYVDEVPERLRVYADMHGLAVDSNPFDRWYDDHALPIRMTIPPDWPLWPIERDAVLLLHTQPVEWPEYVE